VFTIGWVYHLEYTHKHDYYRLGLSLRVYSQHMFTIGWVYHLEYTHKHDYYRLRLSL